MGEPADSMGVLEGSQAFEVQGVWGHRGLQRPGGTGAIGAKCRDVP